MIEFSEVTRNAKSPSRLRQPLGKYLGELLMCLKSLNQQIYDVRKENLELFLNSNNAKMRQAAQEHLDNPTLKDKFNAIIRLILRPAYRKMMRLLDAMLEAQKEERYPSLVNSLSSSDIAERLTAIKELTKYPGIETNKLISDQLLNGPQDVRIACVEALWELSMNESIEPLIKSLSFETNCFTRIMISLCMMSLGDTSSFDTIFDDIAENSIQNDHWDMTDLFSSGIYPQLGEKAIPFLAKGLKHPDWHVRWISLRVIFSAIEDHTQSKNIFGKYSFLRDDPNSEIQELYDELAN